MKQMLKYILSVIMESVKIAENKHGLILALNSGLIALTIGFFNSKNLFLIIMNWLVVLFAGLSIFCCFLGLFARSESDEKLINNKKNPNLLYYKDVANFTPKELLKCIIINYNFPKDYSIDNFELDLSKQIVANSKIAYKKYRFFNFSLVFLGVAIFFDVALMGAMGVAG